MFVNDRVPQKKMHPQRLDRFENFHPPAPLLDMQFERHRVALGYLCNCNQWASTTPLTDNAPAISSGHSN